MSATTTTVRPGRGSQHRGFGPALRAEWVKFRTVRGWSIALLGSILFCVLFTYLVANGNHTGTCTGNGNCTSGHAVFPTGPVGGPVADSYEYRYQPLAGNGTLTVRVASLSGLISTSPADVAPSIAASRPGLVSWAKAGLLLTSSTKQGSPYAAVMATGGHGVRFQYNYTADKAGLRGAVSSNSPRWLRLTRSGETITASDSSDGTLWHEIGATRIPRRAGTVDAGLFVTSPVTYQQVPTQASATFDHLSLNGRPAAGGWQTRSVGARDYYPKLAAGSSRSSQHAVMLSGSGDIAPAVNLNVLGGNTAAHTMLFGSVVALIILLVVATMFITAEYRRGLIRTTFTAIPRRGSVLAWTPTWGG
jgi:hypothetical protein